MGTAQEVAGRVIDAVNAHDIAALRGLYAPDARTRRPGWPQQGGPQELLASYEIDFACVPDIHFGPISTLADGPHVVTEMRITGTNTGPTILGDFGKALLGSDVEEVPPTGRSRAGEIAAPSPKDRSGGPITMRAAGRQRGDGVSRPSPQRLQGSDGWRG